MRFAEPQMGGGGSGFGSPVLGKTDFWTRTARLIDGQMRPCYL